MATGRFPYDAESTPTDYFCPRCKTPLDYEATVYEWDEDWICGECLVDAVHSLSKEDRADITGYSITFTERHFELYRGDAREYAHFLGITTNMVEDIA
jgi:hypothetical protein